MQKLSGWGRYPIVNAELSHPGDSAAAREALSRQSSLIAYGLGRSYGDSALAGQVLQSDRLNHFLGFDDATGILQAQSGVSLDDILRTFVPRGWFPPTTPGTKFITLGGAIASDVHGKNHHSFGCFSQGVLSFDLLQADGSVATCTPQQNAELFRATCGGMGLTGVILQATVQLQRIPSAFFDQTTYRCADLDELLQRYEEEAATPYSVAWVDCSIEGAALGRAILTVGSHSNTGALLPHRDPALSVPLVPPAALMNPFSIQAFNALYYHRVLAKKSRQHVHYEPFFYPLDAIGGWNKLYGPGGFTQHQFVIPKAAGAKALRAILAKIAATKRGSPIAVLKICGPHNGNPLSFPLEGYSLALDFQVDAGLFPLLDELDAMVLSYGGRMYLTKDVHMSEATFKTSYPRWGEFQALREKTGAKGRFASLQSKRLGLE
jgi:decaprenylphospho-beta-D-ribofuranose 2-oxidase